MRIASAQIQSHLGSFQENAKKILEYSTRALEKRCDLVVFPELSLFGYWPGDLLERESVVQEQLRALRWLEKRAPQGIALLVGVVTQNEKPDGKFFKNSAALIRAGMKTRFFHKELLPTYDVFDEKRYFEKGDLEKGLFQFKGKRILVTICEDIWASGVAWKGTRYPKNPIPKLKKLKPDLVLNLSASPFSKGKDKRRLEVGKKIVKSLGAPLLYTNLVGGQDELVFDGGSFFLDKSQNIKMKSALFHEDLNLIDLDKKIGGFREPISEIEQVRQAIVMGIRDYVTNTGSKKVHLGLSGGIDSALVACLASDAVGPRNLTCVALPGPFNAEMSFDLAKELASNLGCRFESIKIDGMYELTLKKLNESFDFNEFTFANENLQARLRAMCLMAVSNRENSLLLSTGNKSELAVGYSTMYGDLAGAISPIGDLLKTQVYELSHHYNTQSELIPTQIIDREPSAELRPDQKDSDSLLPYKELDKIIEKLVVECRPARTKNEKWVLDKIYKSEFKRWQAPPIIRVSVHSFGRGRRYPIAHSVRK